MKIRDTELVGMLHNQARQFRKEIWKNFITPTKIVAYIYKEKLQQELPSSKICNSLINEWNHIDWFESCLQSSLIGTSHDRLCYEMRKNSYKRCIVVDCLRKQCDLAIATFLFVVHVHLFLFWHWYQKLISPIAIGNLTLFSLGSHGIRM